MDEIRGRRVLITGAAGFIGANLVRKLLLNGAEIHALVRQSTNLWRIREIIPKVTLHPVDLTDSEKLKYTVNRVRPEIIFHLAAQGVSPLHQNHREILSTNVLGTFNLLDATAPLDYQLFVHISGSSEYGTKNEVMKESDLPEPVTFYGATKAAATILSRQFAQANSRPVVILRAFSVYGYWESPTRLIPKVIKSAFNNQELALTAYGYRRDFIFVEDVIEACLLTLQAKKIAGEVINIGSGQQWSNEEVVEMVQTLCGRRIKVRVGAYPARQSDKACWVADIGKAKKLLGWEPRHSIRSGLEKTINWFLLHQDAYNTVKQVF